jgi:hypothetical protein
MGPYIYVGTVLLLIGVPFLIGTIIGHYHRRDDSAD